MRAGWLSSRAKRGRGTVRALIATKQNKKSLAAPNKSGASTVTARCPKPRSSRLGRASQQQAIFTTHCGELKDESETAPSSRRRDCARGVPRNRGCFSHASSGKRPGARHDRRSRRIDAHGEDPRGSKRRADAEARLEDGW